MIFDSLNNHALYHGLHPRFAQAFAFLERATKEDLPVGRYEIDGDCLYASVQEYTSKLPSEARYEAHRRYIDIQYIQVGAERMDLSYPENTEIETPYIEEKDMTFFRDHNAPVQGIVHAGEFGIFFPTDVHKPGLCVDGQPAPVKKILIKIAL